MNRFFTRIMSSIVLVALVGAGCAPASSPSVSGGGAPSVPVASKGCMHPYFPIAPGYAVTYASQGPAGKSEYTMSVDSVQGSGAVLAYAFSNSNVTVTQNISCDGGHIVAEGYLDMGSAMGNTGFSFITNSAEGEWLPSNLAVGSEWTSTFDITMQASAAMGLPEFLQNVQSVVTMNRSVMGTEEVTVPAGTYTALKVKSHMTMESADLPVPMNTAVDSIEYWVKGVGMVKSVGEGATIEAQSVTLP